MKKLLSFACSLLLAAVLCTNAHAQFMLDWSINPNGTGSAGAQDVTEYLDVVGTTYLQMTSTGGNNFSFNNIGVLRFAGIDGNNALTGNQLTGIYNLTGVGVLGSSISFTGGTLSLYADAISNYASTTGIYGVTDGSLIATLSLFAGGASISQSGLPNGEVSLAYEFDSLSSGYLFDAVGTDLNTLMSTYALKAFSTTNFSVLEKPSALVMSELTEYATSLGIVMNQGTFFSTTASANGQVRLAPVPEPATVMLMGAGFLGLALVGRKKIVK